jgi:hypothetical protein
MPRLLLFTLFCPLLAAAAAPIPKIDQAWTDLDNGRPQGVFHALKGDLASPEARLAWAAALMSEQPSTDENIRQADGILSDLARGRDEIAAEAAYLSGRLSQLYYSQPDYARASEIYRGLADRQPLSHWAQLGLVKLAMLEMYSPAGADAPADRLAPAEALLPRIHEPLLQRDLQLEIGTAGVALNQPLGRLLPHLVAADRIGGFSPSLRENLTVQIGELSRRAGLLPQAREYFERYLREFPGRLRAYAVQVRLDEVNARLKPTVAR